MSDGTARMPTGRVALYVAGLAAAAAALTLEVRDLPAPLGSRPSWWALVPLCGLLVAAEYLYVRFRLGDETDGLNLMEAALIPIVLAYPPVIAIGSVALSQVVAAVVRRNEPVKGAFNVAQWTLASACAAALVAMTGAGPSSESLVLAVVAALVIVVVVNQSAFTCVVAIATRRSPAAVIRSLKPVVLAGWGVGGLLNGSIALLFVFALDRHPVAVLLFPVPLVVLHLAYRGYAGARTDRLRLAGVHRAVTTLTRPFDPSDAIAPFLEEAAAAFEAKAVLLVADRGSSLSVDRFNVDEGHRHEDLAHDGTGGLLDAALRLGSAVRVEAADRHPLAADLRAEGIRVVLAGPVRDHGQDPAGTADDAGEDGPAALLIVDPGGLEGFEQSEITLFEAMTREVASVLERGRLLATILEQRRSTAEIIDASSDGVLTIDVEGTVRSWNPALERVTGFSAADAVGRPTSIVLRPMTATGERVPLDRWIDGEDLPTELVIMAFDGTRRRLSCSYGRTSGPADPKLVVIVRDLTSAEQYEELKARFGRLAEVEAAQRRVVESLQSALLPEPPVVDSTELAVAHLASEEHSPTGGDLYDWQVLPDGTVHVAVIDVLGHGVTATKHALAVISTLRLLALQECPLGEIVSRADRLLHAQDPDLVATVVVARYDPATGNVTLASGGHPPALHISAGGSVTQLSASGSPIGWPHAGSDGVVACRLDRGESLVLYTDGLVEARRNILDGLDALVETAGELATRPAEEFVRMLVDRALVGAERRDDSLALVIRRTSTPAAPREARWILPVERGVSRACRVHLREFMTAARIAPATIEDVLLAASELVANSVAAGSTELAVSVRSALQLLVLDIADDGNGHPELDSAGLRLPGTEADHGRGLFIVRSLSEDVSILSTSEGTSVRVSFRLPDLDRGRHAVEDGDVPLVVESAEPHGVEEQGLG